jgi:hypothetical protein
MNIEGGEWPALCGASATLAVTRHVCISCHDYMADREGDASLRTRDKVSRLLEAAGFELNSRRSDDRLEVPDYVYGTRRRDPLGAG